MGFACPLVPLGLEALDYAIVSKLCTLSNCVATIDVVYANLYILFLALPVDS